MLSVTGPGGFYKTPVSKVILGVTISSSLVMMFPLHNYRHFCTYTYDLIIERGEYWRLLTSKLAFLDIKHLALSSLLMYNFRFLERRFGSRKYMSYLLATTLLSTVFEVVVLVMCRQLDISLDSVPSGPFCLVFPQFVQFFLKIPRVAVTSIMGVPVTGKTFTYILGLQIASATAESRLVAVCALIASYLWEQNFLKIQSLICVPECISQRFDRLTSWMLSSSPPDHWNAPMGATLELQRQERLERMEDQMLTTALRNSGATINRQNLFHPQPLNDVHGPGIFGNNILHDGLRHRGHFFDEGQNMNINSHTVVSEDQVQRLTEMGFSDESVRQALLISDNDISRATHILLQESS